MTALFDLNRQVLERPELWKVYEPTTPLDTKEEIDAVRRRAFVWYHINVFEIVYADYHSHRFFARNKVDRLYWESWNTFIGQVLRMNPEARAIVGSAESMSLLNKEFADYLRGKVEGLPALQGGANS
jgi:hypothetical protein